MWSGWLRWCVVLAVCSASCARAADLSGEQRLPGRHRYVVDDLLRLCQPPRGFWVDLGAGKGQLTIPLIEATGQAVVMVDPDRSALLEGLRLGREKQLQDRLSAVVGKAEALPFPDASVDLVASRGSIFFWDDPPQGLREVWRVLRPGGRAFIGGGAGSRYPAEALAELLATRKANLNGPDAETWRKFVRLRSPEQMTQWAKAAGLNDFEVLGRGAISADDPRVGQGIWLLLRKPTN